MMFENPRGSQAVETSIAFTCLAFVVVVLRLYARFFLVRCAGFEDYGIVLAMVSIQEILFDEYSQDSRCALSA
jgi:hypothetical protein